MTNNKKIQSEVYPLSRGQSSLWFHYKLAPTNVAYNLAAAVTVSGDTDPESLKRSLQKLSDRHPMLRTLFAIEQGEPVQRVKPTLDISFQCHDSSLWQSDQLDEVIKEEVYRPLDLERGPAWRVTVFLDAPIFHDETKADKKDHLILLVFHHILADLWSTAIIMSEIAAIYREETNGIPASLRILRKTFQDFVYQEREKLTSNKGEAAWKYWQKILSGKITPLNLSTRQPRPVILTGRGSSHFIHLNRTLTSKLRNLAEQQKIPLHVLLLTAYQILLYRYSGEKDILVGFPKAGRNLSTIRVVGYFVNQMVVRTTLSDDMNFLELLNKVTHAIDESSQYDWYPFAELVQKLQPDRDLSRSPLIQTVFSWQQAPPLIPKKNAGAFILGQSDQSIDLEGISIRSVHIAHRVAPFELMLLAAETDEELVLTMEYAEDLFERDMIGRMVESYRTLLEDIVSNPVKSVSHLKILPNVELELLTNRWNKFETTFFESICIHELFENQVEKTPHAVAVVNGNDQLTYTELNKKANQLAQLLIDKGVKKDVFVGIYLESSILMIVAILGILKAGGAYLPLDPSLPKKRLDFIIADAGPALIITREKLNKELSELSDSVICLDSEYDKLNTQTHSNPFLNNDPDQLAYAIYTSGSSGRPKGVMLAHRGVVNLLADFQRRQAIQPGEQCSWWTSPSFDVSVYEIFSSLLAGGSLYIIPEKIRLIAPDLFAWFIENQIHSAYLPPFLIEDFAKWLKNHPGVSFLRRLLLGVEPIPDLLLRSISKQLPDLCLLNGYGPSETTICSTLYQVEPDNIHPGNTPIGKPIANTKIYLLNEALQVVPREMVGEIFIGGVGVARGYINQTELTTDRFIPSPFIEGDNLYRTGDLARFLPDGNLQFIGRVDSQVKFHGMRIELGEIEMILSQHPLVKQAVVLLVDHPAASGKQLSAYVIPTNEVTPTSAELTQFMHQQLPHVMVPTAYKFMESFPLTPSAKIDRQALRKTDSLSPDQIFPSGLANTEKEKILVSIWQQILGLENISIEDNFFELGGDSIMSILVVIHAEEAGLKIIPQNIFQAPTIKQLAALAEFDDPSQDQEEGIRESGRLYFTPIQHWFFEQNFSNPHHWNQSLLFETRKTIQINHLRAAARIVIKQHDVFRMRYYPGKSGWLSEIVEENDVPCVVFDFSNLTALQHDDALRKQIIIQQQSLNITEGPLIRLVFFKLGKNQPDRLLIVIHHLAVDAISWRILIHDFQKAYRQSEIGQPNLVSGKTTSYKVWAQHLAALANSPEFINEATFWKKVLDKDAPALPVDFELAGQSMRDINKESTSRQVSIVLEEDMTQSLLRDVTAAFGAEVLDFLLTALIRMFQKWTGKDVLAINLEAHGRESVVKNVNLTRSVGWFTALYPVILSLPGDIDPGTAIKLIKEQLRSIPHHGLGYGILRYLRPVTSPANLLKREATPSVSFNYLGQLPENGLEDSVFDFAPESVEAQRSPNAHRSHLIEINTSIYQGKLHVEWIYSDRLHRKNTIEQLATTYLSELRQLITYCRNPKIWGYTPSDFPNIKLNQTDLDVLTQTATIFQPNPQQRSLEAIYPLSSMQRGMVFQKLLAPDSDVYFQQTTFILQGKLDISTFRKAWQLILDRHAILRTSFVWQNLTDLFQVVHKNVPVDLELQDWQNITSGDINWRFDNLLMTERKRGFDLAVPPLLRLLIVKLSENEFRFLFSHHHALLDGWSMPILFKEVFTAYEALKLNKEISLPIYKPYSDYISWLQSQDLSKAETFWRSELTGISTMTWSSDRQSSSLNVGETRAAEESQNLTIQTSTTLKNFARKQQLTLGTLMQGAWAILLGHYIQRDEVLFGITVAGRPYELKGIESMVGLFINTLPLRISISPNALLSGWLHQIQETALRIQQFGYTPLAKIPGWSGVSHNSLLFDSILVFENYPVSREIHESFDGLKIRDIRSIEKTTYPLTIAISPDERINIRILYHSEKFGKDFIQQLFNRFIQVLDNMAADSNQLLSTIMLRNGLNFQLPFADRALPTEVNSNEKTSPLIVENQMDGEFDKELVRQNEGYKKTKNALEQYLTQLWRDLLKVDEVRRDDNFFELGGDSLNGAVCVSQLQDALNEPVSLTAIFEAPTIFAFSNYLMQHHLKGISKFLGIEIQFSIETEALRFPSSLVPIQPKGNKPSLFCIHPAGGIVFPYYTLAAYLGNEQPLYGIQDPQLYDPQQESKSIETMAANYVEVLKTIQPEGPYNLLGWSVGGVLAYEVAQQLAQKGQVVKNLILLDTDVPNLASDQKSKKSMREKLNQMKDWIESLPYQIQRKWFAIRPILNYIRSGLFLVSKFDNRKNGTDRQELKLADLLGWAILDTWRNRLLQEAELAHTVLQEESLLLIKMPAVRRILKLIRKHKKLVQQYTAQPYKGEITLFHAVDHAPNKNDKRESISGWRKIAEGRVMVHSIQANHVAFFVKPYVETLAEELTKSLNEKASSELTDIQSQK
jgi:amino acid adenylation domain-containing protein/non-ribosomal peptide synthase protein (TIGR01720 family)